MRHGSNLDPPNRFETTQQVRDLEHLEWDDEYLHTLENRKIEYLFDSSQTIVAQNNSPDLPFRYSVNPYRGCIHACSYCYARPTHEYLGMNAGLDFETKIVVKKDAAALLRKFLSKSSWQSEPIAFSGVTDCYQPAEREFQLTRQCLEVATEFRQPLSIVTKNALVLRDLDLLSDLARDDLAHVFVSITTLNPELARTMEPRTSIPASRLRAIRELADAGVPVGVMVSPIIPGLNDSEIPSILEQAKAAGAICASYVLLRLPLTVEPVFLEWLERTQPLQAEKVINRIQQTRKGKMNDSGFKKRMVGEGEIANQIGSVFKVFRQKMGLNSSMPPHNCDLFQVPPKEDDQLTLF